LSGRIQCGLQFAPAFRYALTAVNPDEIRAGRLHEGRIEELSARGDGIRETATAFRPAASTGPRTRRRAVRVQARDLHHQRESHLRPGPGGYQEGEWRRVALRVRRAR